MLNFPQHFMFELTENELSNLRSQFVASSWGRQRYLPYVFTEYGVLQLANVLRNSQAKQMSIRIIEIFVKLRELLSLHKDISLLAEQVENRLNMIDDDCLILDD